MNSKKKTLVNLWNNSKVYLWLNTVIFYDTGLLVFFVKVRQSFSVYKYGLALELESLLKWHGVL